MEHKSLTESDRCDRCGARAYLRTVHNMGQSTLLWCAHHFREHREHLAPDLVTNQTHLLTGETKKPEPVSP